jgi:hypothetical protein
VHASCEEVPRVRSKGTGTRTDMHMQLVAAEAPLDVLFARRLSARVAPVTPAKAESAVGCQRGVLGAAALGGLYTPRARTWGAKQHRGWQGCTLGRSLKQVRWLWRDCSGWRDHVRATRAPLRGGKSVKKGDLLIDWTVRRPVDPVTEAREGDCDPATLRENVTLQKAWRLAHSTPFLCRRAKTNLS